MMSFAAVFVAATVTLPVAEVKEVCDFQASTYPGRVTPIALVEVVPQVSGEILEVCLANGQAVKEGDVLYRLDPVKYEAAVKNSESKLAECRAKARYAELSYERYKNLLETRAVSLDDVDNALSQRDSTRAALAAAQAELLAARDDLKHCTITAPISGKVGSTAKTKGNYVTSGSLTLVTIVQLAPIRVKFSVPNRKVLDVSSADGSRRPEDFSIGLTLANGANYDGDGALEYADNLADEQTDTMTVYAVFPNEDRKLMPGGTVSVTIASKLGVKRPAIPPTAILQDTQGPYVWAVGDGGRVERRTIARGDQSGDWLFVEKGLRAGERIVADGAHKVRRGDIVRAAQ